MRAKKLPSVSRAHPINWPLARCRHSWTGGCFPILRRGWIIFTARTPCAHWWQAKALWAFCCPPPKETGCSIPSARRVRSLAKRSLWGLLTKSGITWNAAGCNASVSWLQSHPAIQKRTGRAVPKGEARPVLLVYPHAARRRFLRSISTTATIITTVTT